MGFTLQFATFLSIYLLLRGVATLPVQVEDKSLNSKHLNQSDPGGGDFYSDKQRTNNSNVVAGKAVHPPAWSKEDKERQRSDDSNAGAKLSKERSLKNFLSFLLKTVQELKTEVSGIKEITSRKITEESNKSQSNVKDSRRQNRRETINERKLVDAEKNTENKNVKQHFKSNYRTNYYKNEFVNDEETGDDFESSSYYTSDECDDDSSQESEVSQKSKLKRKSGEYSFETKKSSNVLISDTKKPEKGVKKDDGKDDDLKHSDAKIVHMIKESQDSETELCLDEDSDSSLTERNETIEKTESSIEYATTNKHQSERFDKVKTKNANQYKKGDHFRKGTSPLPDYGNPRENSKNIRNNNDSDEKSVRQAETTTLSSESSKSITRSGNLESKNQQYVSGTTSRKSMFKKQQTQITSPKPKAQQSTFSKPEGKQTTSAESEQQITSKTEEQATSPKPEQEQTPSPKPKEQQQTLSPETEEQHQKIFENKVKSFKNMDYSTISSQSHHHKSAIKSSTHNTNTYEAYTSNAEVNNSSKDSKDNESNFMSTRTTLTQRNLNDDGTSDNSQSTKDLGTISGNGIITDNSPKTPSNNLSNKPGTSQNDESEKSGINNQGINGPGNQKDSKTEQSSTNKKLIYSNSENVKKEDDSLSLVEIDSFQSSQDSNREIHIQNNKVYRNQQKSQKNNENSFKDVQYDISSDHEYEYEKDNEHIVTSDDKVKFNHREENLSSINGENVNYDETIQGKTVFTNMAPTVQTEHIVEVPYKQYDTFLEYFIDHSNNPIFLSLRNSSNTVSQN